jgi:hypothetical protein
LWYLGAWTKAFLHNNYIPVGTELTPAQMAALPEKFLATRSVYDPRYAGFEKNFLWENYIRVDVKDNILRMHIRQSLDQFAQTPEGQHIIRQAAAMQLHRYETMPPAQRAKIAHPAMLEIVSGLQCGFDVSNNKLWMNVAQIEGYELLGKSGQYYDMSVQGTLFHEIGHAADATSTVNNFTSLMQSHGKAYVQATDATFAAVRERKQLMRAEVSFCAAKHTCLSGNTF